MKPIMLDNYDFRDGDRHFTCCKKDVLKKNLNTIFDNKEVGRKTQDLIGKTYEMIIRYRKEDPEPGEPVMENYPVRSGRV